MTYTLQYACIFRPMTSGYTSPTSVSTSALVLCLMQAKCASVRAVRPSVKPATESNKVYRDTAAEPKGSAS
jgi:hypothetical protein